MCSGESMATILMSVTNKTGLVTFAKMMQQADEPMTYIASGGTAKTLEEAGIPVMQVSQVTGSPEMIGGRVKTLHPNIHAAILAKNTETDLSEIESFGIKAIDMVICNLYEFEKAISSSVSSEADCIEHIDIGGVALLRAAAKNFDRVTVICDPSDYDSIAKEYIENGCVLLETRRRLAAKAFALCTQYDAAITRWLTNDTVIFRGGYLLEELRYGENPHQRARLYTHEPNKTVLGGTLLQGKQLSYNNILDCDAAWKTVSLFSKPAAVVIKHLTPCGIAELGENASDAELEYAVRAAIACDPVSAFGSIIAVNRTFDEKALEAFGSLFVECLIAPRFTEGVKQQLAKKKNWRIIEAPIPAFSQKEEFRSVLNGFLIQDTDCGDPEHTSHRVVTETKPTEIQQKTLAFAWKACLSVKSNAIVLAAPIDARQPERGFCTVGIGCGQPNRVDAGRHAIKRAGEKAVGSCLASDAFFPFADTVEQAVKAKIAAIIQPGGSIRDDDSIQACNSANIPMIFTGVRHFKH